MQRTTSGESALKRLELQLRNATKALDLAYRHYHEIEDYEEANGIPEGETVPRDKADALRSLAAECEELALCLKRMI